MPCHLSGSGRSDLVSMRSSSTRTDSSPVLVLNSVPVAARMSPTSYFLNASYASPSASRCRKIWIWPVRSWSLAKLALPMMRWNIMRPATCSAHRRVRVEPLGRLVAVLGLQQRRRARRDG